MKQYLEGSKEYYNERWMFCFKCKPMLDDSGDDYSSFIDTKNSTPEIDDYDIESEIFNTLED